MSKGLAIAKKGGGSASVEEASIRGNTQVRIAVIWVVGLVLIILSGGLVAAFLCKPASEFTTYVATVGPIISGAVFGLTGFVIGQRMPSLEK